EGPEPVQGRRAGSVTRPHRPARAGLSTFTPCPPGARRGLVVMAVADTDGQRTSPRGRRARTRHALAAALLGAWLPLAAAQMGGTGDAHVVDSGGEHAGEYWLTGVEFFLCGFGLAGPGWFSAQYFAESPTAWPSSVQVGHR